MARRENKKAPVASLRRARGRDLIGNGRPAKIDQTEKFPDRKKFVSPR
jgi:hypothetical protein